MAEQATPMIRRELILTVAGDPKTKGSLRHVGHGRLIEADPGTTTWRQAIALAARTQLADKAALHEPVGIEITCTLARPPSHFGTGKHANRVKSTALGWPTALRTGDVDKLARCVLDALADAKVLENDAQVVEMLCRKAYVNDPLTPDVLTHPGARIRIYPWPESWAD